MLGEGSEMGDQGDNSRTTENSASSKSSVSLRFSLFFVREQCAVRVRGQSYFCMGRREWPTVQARRKLGLEARVSGERRGAEGHS